MSKKLVQGSSYEEIEDNEDFNIPSIEDFIEMQNLTATPISKEEEELLQKISNPPDENKTIKKKEEVDNDNQETAKSKEISIKIDKLKKIGTKKLLIIGSSLVVLFLITIIVFIPKNNKKEEDKLPAWMDETYTVSSTFKYTAEEIADLRVNGYTGKEIEDYEQMEVSATQLIEQAKAERQAIYDSEVEPYLNSASKEFKELYANTWIGQPELVFDTDTMRYSYYSKNINVDYIKLPARGHQLFIKLQLESGENLFMNVTPEQYISYKDSGNIVVKIYYTKAGNGAVIVTAIEEVLITQ